MSPRRQLKRYRKDNKLSVVQMAALLECSPQFVYALEDGKLGKVPGLLLAERIEQRTDIPRTEWDRIARVNHQRPRRQTA